jgi:hypothetical protein
LIDPDGMSEGNPDVYIDKDNTDVEEDGTGTSQIAFQRLQASTNLPLHFDEVTGQVTVDGDVGLIKDPITGVLTGTPLSNEDYQLLEAINNHDVITNVETIGTWEWAGSFMGVIYNGNLPVKTTNRIDLTKMTELESKYNAQMGSGIRHEITEGYQAGLISINLKRSLQKAWNEGTPFTINGVTRYHWEKSPDYDWYNAAHLKATQAPGEKKK